METWLTEALQGETLPRKQLKLLRPTRGELASWLFESGRRRRRLPTTEVKRLWAVFTTTTALLQLKTTRTTRATRRISAMLDPMTRALLRTPTLLAGTGGARLGATAARRAVRLQRRAHQRPEGEGEGQGCVHAWFGEGFLYIGHAALTRGGVQNELAGPAYRWQEHLVNHARGDTAGADKLRYRMARRKTLGELQYMILHVANEPEVRQMESTAISTMSPNANGRRATTRNANPRARARRRRPRYRERTVIPCTTQGLWDQKKQRERAKRSTVGSESGTTTKLLLPSQASPLRTVPWTEWEGAWWKKSFNELYRMMQKIDRRATVLRVENRSAWLMLLMWLATKEARGQVQWEEN